MINEKNIKVQCEKNKFDILNMPTIIIYDITKQLSKTSKEIKILLNICGLEVRKGVDS